MFVRSAISPFFSKDPQVQGGSLSITPVPNEDITMTFDDNAIIPPDDAAILPSNTVSTNLSATSGLSVEAGSFDALYSLWFAQGLGDCQNGMKMPAVDETLVCCSYHHCGRHLISSRMPREVNLRKVHCPLHW